MNARDHSDHLAALLRKEREAMADFLLALAEFDTAALWRDLGHSSLFSYLRRELALSAGAAQHRKTAVELIHEFHAVETALREGHLCLSSICELAKVVTAENVAEVLPRFYGLSRREAGVVAASIRPASAIPQREVVTPVRGIVLAPLADVPREVARAQPTAAQVAPTPEAGRVVPCGTGPDEALASGQACPRDASEVHPGEPDLAGAMTTRAAVRPPDSEQPLTSELSRIHLTVSREFLDALAQTRDALSHSHPGASTEEILMACMQLMLDRKAKQKGIVARPLRTPRPSQPQHIPAHVRRAVMERSGGRCEWVFENGERCNSTYQVECDHIDPKALGGRATVERTRAACRGHNQLWARRVFGDAVMDRYTRDRRKARAPHAARATRADAKGGATPPPRPATPSG